jgi:hypothetical protein
MSVLGWRLRTVGAAAVACALLVLSSGCGDDDGEAADEGTTTSTSDTTIASTTTTQNPETEVEAAYLAYWEMNKRLVQQPNPDDPEIAQRTSGSARDKLIDSLSTMRAEGSMFQFGPQDSIQILDIAVTGDTATVRSCAVGDATRVHGSEEQDVEISTSELETQMTQAASRWVVTTVSETDSWKGVSTCGA